LTGDIGQHLRLGRCIKINQHIAAEDDVEAPENCGVFQQVKALPTHHGAKPIGNAPLSGIWFEILDQQLHRQTALHFEL